MKRDPKGLGPRKKRMGRPKVEVNKSPIFRRTVICTVICVARAAFPDDPMT